MSLDVFFRPRSIAVFGVSRNPDKPGRVLFDNLLKSGFKGPIYPVNPQATEGIDGHKIYSADKLPPVDLAIFAIPAPLIPEALSQVGGRIKGALIISGGFGEVGRKDLDEQVMALARQHKFRVWGPNCVGIMNPHHKLNAVFLPTERVDMPRAGGIGLLSQSGATICALIDWSNRMAIGFSKVASYGNQLDVSESEIIHYLSKDKDTKAIGFYLEGLKDGSEFLKATSSIHKPIIALKAGRTQKGISAAKSHTGALAGSYEVYQGVFRQKNIALAGDVENMLGALKLLDLHPHGPAGRRVAVVTCGGGFGVMASDALEDGGLEPAVLNSSTLKTLKNHYSEHVVVGNPLDLTGTATPDDFAFALKAVDRDPGVDAIIVVFLFQLPRLNDEIVNKLKGLVKKPLVVVSPPGKYADGVNAALIHDHPLTFTPEQASAILKAVISTR